MRGPAREEILARIRAAQASAGVVAEPVGTPVGAPGAGAVEVRAGAGPTAGEPSGAGAVETAAATAPAAAGSADGSGPRQSLPDGTDLLALFAERVADYRADVARCPSSQIPRLVDEATVRQRVRSLIVPPDLPEEWLARLSGVAVRRDDGTATARDLDGIDGTVTGCAVAIAETGTLVLDAGPTQGRRALTLVPDFHLCVVRADQVVGTVPEALRRLDHTRPLTFISGPSATSDIELRRVEGVHGPRRLVVVLAD